MIYHIGNMFDICIDTLVTILHSLFLRSDYKGVFFYFTRYMMKSWLIWKFSKIKDIVFCYLQLISAVNIICFVSF